MLSQKYCSCLTDSNWLEWKILRNASFQHTANSLIAQILSSKASIHDVINSRQFDLIRWTLTSSTTLLHLTNREQGCSLGLNISVSRSNFKRLGLVKMWEGLGLVSDWKSIVSVSHHKVSFTSRPIYIFIMFALTLKRVQFYIRSIQFINIFRTLEDKEHNSGFAALCSKPRMNYFNVLLI